MKSIELERTFLAKFIPNGLTDGKEMLDIYVPKSARHPILRIRMKGDKFEATKKYPLNEGDKSKMVEQTIVLTKDEFEELSRIEGKRLSKLRYSFGYKGALCEVDVYQGPLKGLVAVDFEFKTEKERDGFEMPDFCLADVTQEEFLAGGMLCGKSYDDIKERLEKLGYKKL